MAHCNMYVFRCCKGDGRSDPHTRINYGAQTEVGPQLFHNSIHTQRHPRLPTNTRCCCCRYNSAPSVTLVTHDTVYGDTMRRRNSQKGGTKFRPPQLACGVYLIFFVFVYRRAPQVIKILNLTPGDVVCFKSSFNRSNLRCGAGLVFLSLSCGCVSSCETWSRVVWGGERGGARCSAFSVLILFFLAGENRQEGEKAQQHPQVVLNSLQQSLFI